MALVLSVTKVLASCCVIDSKHEAVKAALSPSMMHFKDKIKKQAVDTFQNKKPRGQNLKMKILTEKYSSVQILSNILIKECLCYQTLFF